MNGVEPYTWLKEMFNIIQGYPANRIHELLPNNSKMTEKFGNKEISNYIKS